jgi:hypothetical protein
MHRAAVVASCLLIVLGGVSGAAAEPTDLRIGVAFELYTPAKMPSADLQAAQHAVKGLAAHLTAPGYRNYFAGCFRVADNGCPDARIAVAVIFLDKPDPTAKGYPVKMIAHMVTDERPGTVLQLSSVDVHGKVTDMVNPLLPSDTDLQTLLGKPVLADGEITISSYSPYLQLVPETATDRKYLGVLASDLAQQRIQTTPSQFTGIDNNNALASGSGSNASICANSPRYLHYNVNVTQRPRPLQGTTILHVESTGQVIDCVNPGSRLTFGDVWEYPVTTTKSSLSSLITLLGVLFVSKTNSWTNVASAGTNLASFIDVNPSSSDVEQEVYDRALVNLVDRMCATARAYVNEEATAKTVVIAAATTPTPGPAPSVTLAPMSTNSLLVPGEAAQLSTTVSQSRTSPSQAPLSVGELSLAAPPPVTCDSPPPNT